MSTPEADEPQDDSAATEEAKPTHVVLRPFMGGGRNLQRGDLVDASEWRLVNELVDQSALRPLTDDEIEAGAVIEESPEAIAEQAAAALESEQPPAEAEPAAAPAVEEPPAARVQTRTTRKTESSESR